MPLQTDPVFRSVVILSITQIIGWGALFMAISVLGPAIAGDLGMTAAEIFLGPTVMLVVMALCSPLMGRAYQRYGARAVLVIGTLAAVPVLLLLANVESRIGYFLIWGLAGGVGAACLTTSAHAYLAELAGVGARRAIGAQMLAMALAPTLSWPLTDFLQAVLGWREVFVVYALMLLVISSPLHLALPKVKPATISGNNSAQGVAVHGRNYLLVMGLITTAMALNGFITWGFQLVVIDLFRSFSVTDGLAVAFGSAIGIIQMSARLFDFLGANRWNGLSTGIVAAMLMPVSLLVLMLGQGTEWTILLFLLFYGLSSGAMSVSRATIPLVFFDARDYAVAAARLGLPLNLSFAAAPPFFSFVLTRYGNQSALLIAIAASLGTLASLVALQRLAASKP